jgi:glycosyltransferase involved in cell wall biosynthesis
MLTYNRERFVERAIRSVLAQSFRDFEFIVVDNGSSDRGGILADEYAAADDRILVIHRKRGNIGGGRNAGLDAARGGWIAFVDDDDFCEPDFLEFLYGLAVRHGADVSICGAFDKTPGGERTMSAEDALIELLRRKLYNAQFPTKLIRAELFCGVRFSETSKYDDIELMPRILAGANKVAYHGLPKYTFVRHGDNNSAWTQRHELLDSESLYEYLRVYRERTEWLSGKFPDNAAMWRYFEGSFMISMVEKIIRYGLWDCRILLEDMRAKLEAGRDEFESCPWIQDFEREWLKQYV